MHLKKATKILSRESKSRELIPFEDQTAESEIFEKWSAVGAINQNDQSEYSEGVNQRKVHHLDKITSLINRSATCRS